MDRFPDEFCDLLTPEWKKRLAKPRLFWQSLRETGARYHAHTVMQRRTALRLARIMTDALDDNLQPLMARIPAESISGMTENYMEQLPKTMHMRTAYLDHRAGKGYRAVDKINLWTMFHSASFKAFIELVSGYALTEFKYQVICYRHGDHVGPHNDHHPEIETMRDGYIDVHITLANEHVDHQWLVWERRGFFSEIANVTVSGMAAVYKLPFWHYTTPLVGLRGHEDKARRWLLLASGQIQSSRNSSRATSS